MNHALKVVGSLFPRLADGSKTFEVRKDDRGYQTGDTLTLREWHPRALATAKCACGEWAAKQPDGDDGHYTGREIERRVGVIFKQGFGCDLGEYVVLSLIDDDAAADLRAFKPEPMSQLCRDGNHGGQCSGCACLCHWRLSHTVVAS